MTRALTAGYGLCDTNGSRGDSREKRQLDCLGIRSGNDVGGAFFGPSGPAGVMSTAGSNKRERNGLSRGRTMLVIEMHLASKGRSGKRRQETKTTEQE